MYDYEIKHNEYLRSVGAECTVLLKKDECFPVDKPSPIALYGSGARNTIKGGTGSGEVNSRFYVTVQQGLEEAGFEILSKKWLDEYGHMRAQEYENFKARVKEEAKEQHQNIMIYSMGKSMEEPEYQIPLDAVCDTAIYVLSRISGEGADRQAISGEILLSETEIRDILECNKKYEKFMLVLNVGGVVDLSPVMEVKNILILSQLGVCTGNILADILLGKQNPSGKLTTTWSRWDDYSKIGEFGEKHDTRYKEGIYVGYRYFDTADIIPLFPFGHGLSYSEFRFTPQDCILDKTSVKVSVDINNTGEYAGKEVMQVYVSVPNGELNQPYQSLQAFHKTKTLMPGETERIQLSFDMKEIASYDEKNERYILEAGDYIVRVGNSSRNTMPVAIIQVDRTITVKKVKNVLGKPDFEELRLVRNANEELCGVKKLHFDASQIQVEEINYTVSYEIDERVKNLSEEQLLMLNLGAFDRSKGVASIIGNAGFTVAGAAGQSSLEAGQYGIKSMVMADGPAGLRISKNYVKDKKGQVHTVDTSLPESFLAFMPKPVLLFMKLINYKPKRGDVPGEQYATAIPIGTAIAQSFNEEFAEKCGDIIGFEMEKFGVHLWLAPALNLHRSIQCGRNFEYYSEDPLISGKFAAAITRGVQSHPHCGTTIKHFAFNNQERNRTQNNSIMSERTAREIYLKGFEICVKESQPKAIMTSYNLINGIHTSEHPGLIEDILRREFGFEGIVMTDWVIAGYENEKNCIHPVATADLVAKAGGDLFMPGSKHDYNVLKNGLHNGTVTRKQLEINGSRVAKMADVLVK